MFDCTNVKAGDRVWIGWMHHERCRGIHSVVKVTRTQVVVSWRSNPTHQPRFKRENGYGMQGGSMRDHISGIATPEECATWDAEQAAQLEAERRKQSEKEAREANRLQLASLFASENVYLTDEQWGEKEERDGKWTLQFHFLTDEQVRQIAGRMAEGK